MSDESDEWVIRPHEAHPVIALAINDESDVSPEVAAAVKQLMSALNVEPARNDGCVNKCWALNCEGQGGCGVYK
jgi:hypothetical protein